MEWLTESISLQLVIAIIVSAFAGIVGTLMVVGRKMLREAIERRKIRKIGPAWATVYGTLVSPEDGLIALLQRLSPVMAGSEEAEVWASRVIDGKAPSDVDPSAVNDEVLRACKAAGALAASLERLESVFSNGEASEAGRVADAKGVGDENVIASASAGWGHQTS